MSDSGKVDGSIFSYIALIPDPRVEGRCQHSLVDIIVIVVCSVLGGCESWNEIEVFAKERDRWLKGFLSLSSGIPSHDTLARVFSLINPKTFEKIFTEWVSVVRGKQKVLSVDGKTVAGTHEGINTGKTALHLVSVLCRESGLVLGQARASSSGNAEGDAALKCLEGLVLKGTTVTVDAGLSSNRMCSTIQEREGDYLCPIKRNHRRSLKEISKCFEERKATWTSTEEKSHGREEKRKCLVLSVKDISEEFKNQWPGVKTLIRLHRTRRVKDKRYALQERGEDGKITYRVNPNRNKMRETTEITHYICTRELSSEQAMDLIRSHWGIENKLHWSLDVAFNEDAWKVREKTTAHNLSLARKICFNLLQSNSDKGSKKVRMKKAGWSHVYMERLLFGTV